MTLKAGDILFLDTNILLIATDKGRNDHEKGLSVFPFAIENGIHLALSGQIIREYLVVATRLEDENGLGLSTPDALKNIEEFSKRTLLLEETDEVSVKLLSRVGELNMVGKRIHDANVAATIIAHSVHLLLTANAQDFRQFSSIDIIGLNDLL